MCKFHKSVARALAADPSGRFDPARYSVALVAVAKYRIEQYMPAMFGCDGYSPAAMAGSRGAAAFAASGLKDKNFDIAESAKILRAALDDIAAVRDLSLSALNLPDDPVRDTAMLDAATVALFDGYTAPGYAAGELRLKPAADDARQENLRAAAAEFLQRPGVEDALRALFEDSVTKIFTAAPAQTNPFMLRLHDRVPQRLKDIFKTCAMCAGTGAGGVAVSHLGCLAVPLLAGASGAALSGTLAGMMLVASPVIAMGVTYALCRRQQVRPSALRLGITAAFAVAAALGFNALNRHEHAAPADQHHHAQNLDPAGQAWLESLNMEKRKEVEAAAAASGLGLPAYIRAICRPEAPQAQP